MRNLDRQSTTSRPSHARLGRRWSHRLTIALAALAVGAAALPQVVLSADPEAERVDPDCLPLEEAMELEEKRDGVCPGRETPSETPAPSAGGTPESPSAGKPPSAPEPVPPAAAPSPPQSQGKAPSRTKTAGGDGDREPSRTGTRSGSPTPAGGHDRRDGARRNRRASGPRKRRQAAGGPSSRRRHARKRSRTGAGRSLRPIPGWARSLLAQPLPDPLPAGKRLDPSFAGTLQAVASRHRTSWPLMLAILRARGRDGAAPATGAELRGLARKLQAMGARGRSRRGIEALAGTSEPTVPAQVMGLPVGFADRVLALAAYHRAVGLRGLVRGVDAVKPQLIERVLSTPGLDLYPGGRADVGAGRIDERVLILMLYLTDRHRTVRITSLQTGHSFFTKSGNVSNHTLGRAADIAALEGAPIMGHQGPGGLTERALRNILLMPKEMWPSELISLFELGGPSFAMADHADHIHAGY